MTTYADSAAFSGTLSYQAPGGVSSRQSIGVAIPYNASGVGFVDVPDATATGTSFTVPFGAVASASGVIVTNKLADDISLSFNAVADSFRLAPGATIALMMPAMPTTGLVAGLTFSTTNTQAGLGQVEYGVFGA